MKKDHFTFKEGYGTLIPDPQEMMRVQKIILEALEKADVSMGDGIASLCLSLVRIAHFAQVAKPSILYAISTAWEMIDRYEEDHAV